MAKVGELTLIGKSGSSYEFSVYAIDTNFRAVGAVYYISKRTSKPEGGGSHTALYVGQTEDLSERFNNHHKMDCCKKKGANCISVHLDGNEKSRLKKESDLVDAINPPCNG